MGWLDVVNIGLNLTNAAVSAGNAAKLEEMRRQGAASDAVRAITIILRDQIFQYKQSADTILVGEQQSPKIAAASMKFLEVNLDHSRLTPSLFTEIGDKEYCANTIKLIKDNSARMFSQLSDDERSEVNLVIAAATQKPDYEYYLEHYDRYQEFEITEPVSKKYASRNSCLAKSLYLLWGYFGLLVPFVSVAPFIGSDSSAGAALGLLFGAGVYLAGFVGIYRFQHTKDYGRAKKTVEAIGETIDISRMRALDAEFGGKEQTQRQLDRADAILDGFLQGEHLLP